MSKQQRAVKMYFSDISQCWSNHKTKAPRQKLGFTLHLVESRNEVKFPRMCAVIYAHW